MKESASGYEKRTSYPGCTPDGCIPENPLDNSLSSNSRRSCEGGHPRQRQGAPDQVFLQGTAEPLAFYNGDENTRALKVYSNGNYHKNVKSSGKTNEFQTFDLDTRETSELKLFLNDYKSNCDVWFSLTKVCGGKELQYTTLRVESVCIKTNTVEFLKPGANL